MQFAFFLYITLDFFKLSTSRIEQERISSEMETPTNPSSPSSGQDIIEAIYTNTTSLKTPLIEIRTSLSEINNALVKTFQNLEQLYNSLLENRRMQKEQWLSWEKEKKEGGERHQALMKVFEGMSGKLETVANNTHQLRLRPLPNLGGS